MPTANKTSNKMKPLTDRALRVVNCIEQKFWENGGLPTHEVVARKVGETENYVKGVVEKNSLARKPAIQRVSCTVFFLAIFCLIIYVAHFVVPRCTTCSATLNRTKTSSSQDVFMKKLSFI